MSVFALEVLRDLSERSSVMDNKERYERAKRRVAAMKVFYIHLALYLAVIAFLFFIDVFVEGNPNNWWVQWPAMGWGIAIAVHAISVFGPFMGSGWEDRKIRELMNKEVN